MQYLNSKEKAVINCFIKNIEASKLPVYEISLFGSKARGDFNKDSDIDVLVLVHGKEDIKILMDILDIGYDSMVEILGEDEAIPFRKVVFFEEQIDPNHEFFYNIEKDKIILWKN